MSRKDKHKQGRKPVSTGASKQEPFFRPFADLPAPAAHQPASGKPAQDRGNAAAAPAKTPSSALTARPAEPQARARSAAGRPRLEDEDALTFERFMSGVTPLQPSGARRLPVSSDDPGSSTRSTHNELIAKRQEAEDDARARLHALVEEGSPFEVVDDGRRIEGRRRGVDGRLVRRMRLGDLPIDATLDLHGMRVDEARQAVESFVRDRRVKADRVVAIVHGRGRNSPAGLPVLRGEVAAWLSEGKASTHVAAFVTAPEAQGGEGAMCVLLASQNDRPRRV